MSVAEYWNSRQAAVDTEVDRHVTDKGVYLRVKGVRYAVPATYRAEEALNTTEEGHQVVSIREYLSISNKYLPPNRIKNQVTVERLDTTGPCDKVRYYDIVAVDRLREGRTKLILRETMVVDAVDSASRSPRRFRYNEDSEDTRNGRWKG